MREADNTHTLMRWDGQVSTTLYIKGLGLYLRLGLVHIITAQLFTTLIVYASCLVLYHTSK